MGAVCPRLCTCSGGEEGGLPLCPPPPPHNSGVPPPPVPEGLSQSQLLGQRNQSVHALCHPLCPPHWTVYRGRGGGGGSAHCRNLHHRHHNIHKGPQGGPAVVTRANTVWGTRLLFGPLLLLHYQWVAWAPRPPHDLQKPNGGGDEGGGGGRGATPWPVRPRGAYWEYCIEMRIGPVPADWEVRRRVAPHSPPRPAALFRSRTALHPSATGPSPSPPPHWTAHGVVVGPLRAPTHHSSVQTPTEGGGGGGGGVCNGGQRSRSVCGGGRGVAIKAE